MKRNHWGRLALTSFLGIALSYTFVFLAALPIRHLRLTYGRTTFVAFTLLSATLLGAFGMWQWLIVHLTLCLLIGCYRELEERGQSIFEASIQTLAFLAILMSAGGLFVVKNSKQSLSSLVTGQVEPLYVQLKEMPRFQETEIAEFIWFLPSGLIITLMLVLFISLALSRTAGSKHSYQDLRAFRLPDWAIWAFIASLACTFIKTSIAWLPTVSMNILAITLAAYFFQGLAVFTHFLDRLKLFGIWRMLAYFLAFFQMFIFISGLGIIDYWFDFRASQNGLLRNKTYNRSDS